MCKTRKRTNWKRREREREAIEEKQKEKQIGRALKPSSSLLETKRKQMQSVHRIFSCIFQHRSKSNSFFLFLRYRFLYHFLIFLYRFEMLLLCVHAADYHPSSGPSSEFSSFVFFFFQFRHIEQSTNNNVKGIQRIFELYFYLYMKFNMLFFLFVV